jgi:ribosome recycling factor
MKPLQSEIESSLEFFKQDINTLRVGRAHPALVEHVQVDYYGTPTPLIQLASITTTDAKTLLIQPWDKNGIKDIERALTKADLGSSPLVDGTSIRIIVPSLTEERRLEMVKLLGDKTENARVAMRQHREEAIKLLKQQKEAGEISEDAFFTSQKEVQQHIDDATSELQKFSDLKIEEITTI